MEAVVNIQKRKKIIRNSGLILFTVVVLLTFFSNTINNLLIPEVETAMMKGGVLQKEIEAAGVIQAEDIQIITGFRGWKIKEIKVKANDEIESGTILAVVDQQDLNMQLRRKELDILRLQNNLLQYKAARTISGSGTAAQDEVYQGKVKEMLLEIDLNKIEYNNLKTRILKNGTLISPTDGKVGSVNIRAGDEAADGQILFEIVGADSAYRAEWALSKEKAELIDIGETVMLTPEGDSQKVFKGKVTEKSYEPAGKTYRFLSQLSGEEAGLTDGQQVRISYTKMSVKYPIIIPNAGIIFNGDRGYVFLLKTRDGILGTEKYAEMVEVKIEESDDTYSAVKGNLDSNYDVITFRSKPLMDGMQVKTK